MTAPNSLPPLLRWLSSFLVALMVLGPGVLRADVPPAGAPTAETLSMSPGASLEREILGGASQAMDLPLGKGTFILLETSLRSLELSFRLVSPGGETLVETAGFGPHFLAAVAGLGGMYRLEAAVPKGQTAPTWFKVKILELRPAVPGDDARVRAARALEEARHLLAQDGEEQRRQAENLLAESLAAWRVARDSQGEVTALLDLAVLQSRQGLVDKALASSDAALKLSQETGFVEGEARSLASKSACYMQAGQHDRAIEFSKASFEIWSRIGGPYEHANILQKLGRAYERKQSFEEALRTFNQALPLAEAGGDVAQQARILSSIGAGHYYLGHPGEAREFWERALGLSRRGGDTETEALIEINLAVLYHNQGQFQRAVDLYSRVAEGVAPADAGLLRSNMGDLYSEMGSPERALENYALAREAYDAVGDLQNKAVALLNIGRAHQKMGELQTALNEYEEARKAMPQASWSVYQAIGLVQADLGRLREAVSALTRALELARETRNPSREVATLLALGRAHFKLGQPDAAAESLGQAISKGTEIGYQSAVSEALLERALVRRRQGRFQDGLADVQKALEFIESRRQNVPGDQLRIGFFATKRTYYDLQIDLLMQLDRAHPGPYKAQALEASERARARGLLDLLAEGRIDLNQGLDPDLRRREENLSGKISQAQRDLRDGNLAPERARELQGELRRLDQEREQLDQDIRVRNKKFAEVRYPTPSTLKEIQSRILDGDTALLEYALGEKRSILFVATRDALQTYDLPAAGEIELKVRRWRATLERENLLTGRDYQDLAFQLYRDLLQPASAALAGKTKLLIVPDGALYYIPFEAVLTEPAEGRPFRGLPYLLRRYSIAYIPSASVLAGLRERRPEPSLADRKQLAAFAPFASPGDARTTRGSTQGSPSAPASGRWSFEPLPASRREISEIAGLYSGKALSFVGEQATEDVVAHDSAVASALRLHFATHAQIDERYPERSALVLAEQPGGDGLLQAREIFNLKLSADLAVLSACQTALGKEVTGEGLVGLSRAFFYAGVPSLVVSLWNVVDGPTPDLMLAFYQDLGRLQDKAKALQAAKLSMINGGTYSHPSFWAPFILLGEPR